MLYEMGFQDAIDDYNDGLCAKATHDHPSQYRNGYSDGYFHASGQEKTW